VLFTATPTACRLHHAHITSAIMGRRRDKRLSAVRWGVAGNIVTALVLTFPAAAGVAACVPDHPAVFRL